MITWRIRRAAKREDTSTEAGRGGGTPSRTAAASHASNNFASCYQNEIIASAFPPQTVANRGFHPPNH